MRRRVATCSGLAVVLALVCACQGPQAAADDATTVRPTPPAADYCATAATDALPCVPESRTLFVAITQATIMLAPDVAIQTEQLRGRLVPQTPEPAVVLDDLSQFEVQVNSGQVHLSTAALAALVRDRFGAEAAVRGLKLSQQGRQLVLDGEFRRRGWVPFHLTGRLSRLDATHLVLRPTHLSVDGRPAMALMRAAHLALADIIALRTPAFKVRDNQIEIDVPALLPPPAITFEIADAALDARGLNLVFDDGQDTPAVATARPAGSYVLLHGGQLAIGPLHTDDPRIQLESADADQPLTLSLADYRAQLAGGHIQLLAKPARATFIARLAAPESGS